MFWLMVRLGVALIIGVIYFGLERRNLKERNWRVAGDLAFVQAITGLVCPLS